MSPREPGDDTDERHPSPVQRFGVRSIRSMLRGVHERAIGGRPSRGVPCGNGFIDALLGGFRPGRVTVCGASTSWGKSSFAVQVTDVGLRAGAHILLVSGEDSEDTYGQRLMARRMRKQNPI